MGNTIERKVTKLKNKLVQNEPHPTHENVIGI